MVCHQDAGTTQRFPGLSMAWKQPPSHPFCWFERNKRNLVDLSRQLALSSLTTLRFFDIKGQVHHYPSLCTWWQPVSEPVTGLRWRTSKEAGQGCREGWKEPLQQSNCRRMDFRVEVRLYRHCSGITLGSVLREKSWGNHSRCKNTLPHPISPCLENRL